jgi:CopG family transcriptional regulator, nickel-responsive regulator
MERITISIESSLAHDFDVLIEQRAYASRSEAIRDLVRREVESQRGARDAKTHCVATLSCVYNRRERQLGERLALAQHAHHDLVVSSTRVALDHENCLETVILKGTTAAVRAFADRMQAERGVRHGQLNLVPVETGDAHTGAAPHRHQGHLHLIPRS